MYKTVEWIEVTNSGQRSRRQIFKEMKKRFNIHQESLGINIITISYHLHSDQTKIIIPISNIHLKRNN